MASRNELDPSVMVLVSGTENWIPLDRLPDSVYSKKHQNELRDTRQAFADLDKATKELGDTFAWVIPTVIVCVIIIVLLKLIQ
jgi:hypothetical protein